MPRDWLREKLAGQVRDTLVHPVYFGSAITGAGVEVLLHELAGLLPAAGQDAGGPVSGRVFKVERGPAGDKIAYVRMFSGTIATRDRVRFGRGRDGKVTAISVFADGTAARSDEVTAGQIARLSGLAEIQIGDAIGTAAGRRGPALLRAADAGDRHRGPRPARQAAAARRHHRARRAGPAHQRPPGRHPAGDLRLPVRRGPEAGDRGHPGHRVRDRDRLPGNDADLRRTARPHRHGRGNPARAGEPVPRHAGDPHRPGPGGLGHRVPARGRPPVRPAVHLQEHGELRRRHGAVRHRRRCARASTAGRSPTARCR